MSPLPSNYERTDYMKRKSCLAVIALLTAFGMAGCSENHSADYSIQTPETSLYAYGENMYGNGMLYTIMNSPDPEPEHPGGAGAEGGHCGPHRSG